MGSFCVFITNIYVIKFYKMHFLSLIMPANISASEILPSNMHFFVYGL